MSLHPSKVRVFNAKDTTSTSKVNNCPVTSSTSSEESCSDSQDNYEPLKMKKSRKTVFNRIKLASNLVVTESLSTNKSARISKKLNEKSIEIETPSQTGIWRSTIRQGESKKKIIIKIVQEEYFCLHFVGMKISMTKYQVYASK